MNNIKLTLRNILPDNVCFDIWKYDEYCDDCSEIRYWNTVGLKYVLNTRKVKQSNIRRHYLLFENLNHMSETPLVIIQFKQEIDGIFDKRLSKTKI